jgi:hypothetical protein
MSEGYYVVGLREPPQEPGYSAASRPVSGRRLTYRGCLTWEAGDGGPLLLVAGGSGVVPLPNASDPLEIRAMDDKLRLDGNAAAGSLREIFSFEVTTAQYACEGCGRNPTL